MKTVQANNIEEYFMPLRIDDGERLFLRGTSTNPIFKILIIPSCIFFYLLGAGLNSAINPDGVYFKFPLFLAEFLVLFCLLKS